MTRIQSPLLVGFVTALGLGPAASAACSSTGASAAPDAGFDASEAGVDAPACSSPNGPFDAAATELELPSPSGAYAIGTQARVVVDSSRTDPQAPDAGTKRVLMVQLFYPTDSCASGNSPVYMQPLEAARFECTDAGPLCNPVTLPAGWEQQVLVHARAGLQVASTGTMFPVVLFSHGLGGLRPSYQALIEDLVSHGFVVAAISHTYDSAVVVFPDNTVAWANMAWEGSPPDLGALNAHIEVWVQDARFVLDQLTSWNQSDPSGLLTGRLDLDHVGMFGHSYGGATAAEVCALDPRFKAGINLDGTFFSPALPDGGRAIPTPFMMQLNEQHGLSQTNDPTPGSTYNLLQDAGYAVQIAGARHGTFWDMPLAYDKFDGPDAWPDYLGTIDHAYALSIIDAYTLAFFRKFLSGTNEALLDGPPPYPEVTFNKR